MALTPAEHVIDQYADGRQVSLVVLAAADRPGAPPGARQIRAAEVMQFLDDDADVVGIFRPKHVWLSDYEQDITTPAELAAVLNAVARRSGIPLKYLAVAAGIPRAQLYSLTGNERMPRNADQLISPLSVSGLTTEDIEHVLRRWRQLRTGALVTRLADVGAEEAAPLAAVATAEPDAPSTAEEDAGSAKPSIARTWARFRALFAGDRPQQQGLPLP
ncbi:hypothetical protein [Amycolatopsis vastitatis]|uniref:hypothetical protein n=1 Tax=Amycolatopsis vastitatis TaxID=1905142 RepID=UPI001177D592|nr:hypothetical protein [Amycolatopsis vastitatis]